MSFPRVGREEADSEALVTFLHRYNEYADYAKVMGKPGIVCELISMR